MTTVGFFFVMVAIKNYDPCLHASLHALPFTLTPHQHNAQHQSTYFVKFYMYYYNTYIFFIRIFFNMTYMTFLYLCQSYFQSYLLSVSCSLLVIHWVGLLHI